MPLFEIMHYYSYYRYHTVQAKSLTEAKRLSRSMTDAELLESFVYESDHDYVDTLIESEEKIPLVKTNPQPLPKTKLITL